MHITSYWCSGLNYGSSRTVQCVQLHHCTVVSAVISTLHQHYTGFLSAAALCLKQPPLCVMFYQQCPPMSSFLSISVLRLTSVEAVSDYNWCQHNPDTMTHGSWKVCILCLWTNCLSAPFSGILAGTFRCDVSTRVWPTFSEMIFLTVLWHTIFFLKYCIVLLYCLYLRYS